MRQLCGAVDDEVAGDVRGGVEDTAASTCTPLALGILRVFFLDGTRGAVRTCQCRSYGVQDRYIN